MDTPDARKGHKMRIIEAFERLAGEFPDEAQRCLDACGIPNADTCPAEHLCAAAAMLCMQVSTGDQAVLDTISEGVRTIVTGGTLNELSEASFRAQLESSLDLI